MLRQASNYAPQVIYCEPVPQRGDGYYNGTLSFKINTSSLNACVVCVKADITTERGQEFTLYYTDGTWSKTIKPTAKPLYNGDTLSISIGDSAATVDDVDYPFMSWYSGENSCIKLQLTLYQGDINDVSSEGTFDLSTKDYLCDNKLCRTRVYSEAEKEGDQTYIYVSSGIDNIDNTCIAVIGGDTYKIVSYNYKTGFLKLDPAPTTVKKQQKVMIYTPFIICPAEKFELRKLVDNPLSVYSDCDLTDIFVYGKYNGNVPVLWYRWTIDNKYKSPKIYRNNKYDHLGASYDFKYNLFYPPTHIKLEVCDSDRKIYTIEQDVSSLVVTSTTVPSTITQDNSTIDVTFSGGSVSEKFWATILAVDEDDNVRLVNYKYKNTTKYTETTEFKDYCAKADKPIRYCFICPTLVSAGVYGLIADITDYYTPSCNGRMTLQELTKAGSHLYHTAGKSIAFYTPDSNTDVKTNVGINVFDNGRQPQIIKSEKDYEEGNCTVDLLEYKDGEIIDNTDRIKLWQSILKSDSPYLLKTPKGECFIVAISDAGGRTYNNETGLTTLTFGWKEIDKYSESFIMEE